MKILAMGLTLIATVVAPVVATAQEAEGRRLAQLAFASVDSGERGHIDLGQFVNFGSDVFFSMDSDEDGVLSLAEFMSWDYGMQPLAESLGREDAYETALRIVFAFWDRNGNNEITRTEHRQSLSVDFRRADTDNDALLTETEFTGGFSVMVALRAAVNPAPVE